MSGPLIVTTSWDDGHPLDMRVAEMLARHGLAGTFYVPSRNSEGRPVLDVADIKTLSAGFEIGGHGRDHVVLTGLAREEVRVQVSQNKAWLEDLLGRRLRGFCHIRGEWNAMTAEEIRAQGFAYARAVTGFHASTGRDPFAVPTTMQFFAHGAAPVVRHLLRRGPSLMRVRLACVALGQCDLPGRVEAMAAACRSGGGYFHLWGHSWEIEEYGLWEPLDRALGVLASLRGDARFLTNDAAFVAAGLIPAP